MNLKKDIYKYIINKSYLGLHELFNPLSASY